MPTARIWSQWHCRCRSSPSLYSFVCFHPLHERLSPVKQRDLITPQRFRSCQPIANDWLQGDFYVDTVSPVPLMRSGSLKPYIVAFPEKDSTVAVQLESERYAGVCTILTSTALYNYMVHNSLLSHWCRGWPRFLEIHAALHCSSWHSLQSTSLMHQHRSVSPE